MDYSATFARHFARLVSLLMHDVADVDEQKVSLRALVALSKNDPFTILGQDWQLLVNDQVVPGALTGVTDVASQLAAHSIVTIKIAMSSSAADLLGVARIVAARAADPGDGGAHAWRELRGLGAKTIEFVTTEPDTVAPVAETPTPAVTPDEGGKSANARVTNSSAAARSAAEAPTLLTHLTAPDVSKFSASELFTALDAATTGDSCTKVLDDLALFAEYCLRVGKAPAVGDIFHGIVSREAGLPDGEVKRAYVIAIRRMSKPVLLRGVASLIAKRPDRKQHYYAVLERAGEDGAEALIEQITQAPTIRDRKTLFEVFRELQDAVPALKRMLGDSRWFVVRNAADLLGELAATDAEQALIALLKHADDRVRRSATNALLRLGTPDALKAIYEAVNDSSPEVRIQAAARRSGRSRS